MMQSSLPPDNAAGRISHDPRRCLHAHHHASSCSSCMDVCDSKALSLVEGVITLAASRCTACGACIAACPTDAIAFRPDSGKANVKDRMREDRTPAAVITCSRVKDAARSSTERIEKILCLQALKPAQLAELALRAQQPLTAVIGDCDRCDKKNQHASAASLADKVNDFFNRTGAKARVDLRVEKASLDWKRRQFFTRFWKSDGGSSAAAAPKESAFQQPHAGEPWHRIPDSHAQTVQLLLQTGAKEPEPLLSPLLPACRAERCEGCPACIMACPTGALAVSRQNEALDFSLAAQACISCGLCAAVCVKEALSMRPAADCAERLNPARRTLWICRAPQTEPTFESRMKAIFNVPVYRS